MMNNTRLPVIAAEAVLLKSIEYPVSGI